jgi:hypothetical protein
MDRSGRYTGKTDYNEQLLLATSQMRRVVERLRELGKFDSSLILLHSDHGTLDEERKENDRLISQRTSQDIREVDVMEQSGQDIATQHSALLLVKPPVSCGAADPDLKIDEQLVEIKGLRSFIEGVRAGQNCNFPIPDSVHVITGLAKQKINGQTVVLGRDIQSGSVSHYRVNKDFSWEILPPVPFKF